MMATFTYNGPPSLSGHSAMAANGHDEDATIGPFNSAVGASSSNRSTLVIIESRTLLRECLERSIRARATFDVSSFSSVTEWLAHANECRAVLVILSIGNLSKDEMKQALALLAGAVPIAPTIVVAEKNDLNEALEALSLGARGYLPTTIGLDVAIEAMQFVIAGGTYVPAECALAARRSSGRTASNESNGTFTSREIAVIQAIRQGLSNKMIADQLNMCESTVKVHVRHIMKKLHAQNRTEVAIRAAALLNFSD